MKGLFINFNYKKTIVLFVLGLIISFVSLLVKGFDSLLFYCDAFFIAGFVILAFGILAVLSFFGAFDTLGYSMYSFTRAFSKKEEMSNKKYVDLVDYVEKKKEKRGKFKTLFLPYLFSGGFYILLFIILFIFI